MPRQFNDYTDGFASKFGVIDMVTFDIADDHYPAVEQGLAATTARDCAR